MAGELIDRYTGSFDIDKYRDTLPRVAAEADQGKAEGPRRPRGQRGGRRGR